jgi:hypothetical protein
MMGHKEKSFAGSTKHFAAGLFPTANRALVPVTAIYSKSDPPASGNPIPGAVFPDFALHLF